MLTSNSSPTLNDLVGQEVFVLCPGEDAIGADLIYIAESLTEIDGYCANLDPATEGDYRVLHGVLISGEYLPSSWRGKTPYIIIQDPLEEGRAIVVEGDGSIDAVASQIEDMMEYTQESFSQDIEIENVFILVGYQIQLLLTTDFDGLDEEAIFRVNDIAEEVETARQKELTASLTGD